MGELIPGDDGNLVEEVGSWATTKHEYLRRYIDISRGVRQRFIGPRSAGATYIDLFSGPGRAKIRNGEFIDGSCVAAWEMSRRGGSPFSEVIIADSDPVRLQLAEHRLRKAGAPVKAHLGKAADTAKVIAKGLNPYALHFAFIDPFNLGAFDFEVMKAFAGFQRIDTIVHVSKMDLQRNLGFNVKAQQDAFEIFAPGWRSVVDLSQPQAGIRRGVFDHWRNLVAGAGIAPSANMKLITGSKGQHLYWLLLAAKHDLAHKFWKEASNDGQGSLF
ncbi:three-Cys-motif partner protein TcmP [Rhizobium lentis]|uniref:three-Cys-motif partner protein TcmP n=1 Tax=Rhizobium lentis TaxID=1138194 RepID=UPI001C83EBE9|nr:three-Cys-motif partner protein TcmP [Rhizobium lentis]MBX5130963.1 three-Cys-motif partner protein TcmP [Rhizobium lentis]